MDEDELLSQIEDLKKELDWYNDMSRQLMFTAAWTILGCANQLVDLYGKCAAVTKEQIKLLEEKLERLYEINQETTGLFESVFDWYSAINEALNDLQVNISGEGAMSSGKWRSLVMEDYGSEVGAIGLSGALGALGGVAEGLKGSTDVARVYSDLLVEFVKGHEGFSATAYNNGKTIGYGFDFYVYPSITIIYNEDGNSITEKEGERLLRIILDQSTKQINTFLDENNLQVDQNAYDALTDLYYNRNSNDLTKEVTHAMAMQDDKKVQELLDNFDYRYALKYIYNGDTTKAQAYVDRNSGLETRRNEEYSIYKNGVK